jgi:glycyl-tRNA synthetase beta chain
LDVAAGKETRGHRFHHPHPISVDTPADYERLLRDVGYVEADFTARRERIRVMAEEKAKDQGAAAVIDPGLLDEVTALTEWPVAVKGSFDEEFLEVPSEALIETMQKHQKYFPVTGSDGKLLPKFIAISNIESLEPTQVQAGNERVIRPRFKDASFFWEQDLKRPLEDLAPALDKVVFQHQLGTLRDKSIRIGAIGRGIAEEVGLDPTLAERSAALCKCDLLTNMVGEFAGLQGTMGRYYASAGGEQECVADAMEEQYLPRHAGDALPKSRCGQVLALADRLDSLVGIFAIGQKPTGVKDPYALRRASLGVLRILIETPLELDLYRLLQSSADALSEKVDASAVVDEVYQYILERLHGYYADQGVSGDIVESVLASGSTVPVDIDNRVKAVTGFKSLPEASSLAAANKRIRNILKKVEGTLPDQVDHSKLEEESEKALFSRVEELKREIDPLMAQREYGETLNRLATLRPVVDEFFDNVMVLCDDETLRLNRLSLLNSLSATFQDIADISKLN